MINNILNWHWIHNMEDLKEQERNEKVRQWVAANCTKYNNKELKRIVIKALNDESYDLP